MEKIIPKSIEKFTYIIILAVLVIVVKTVLDWYLKTKSGLLLRAVGDNDVLVTSVAKNKGIAKIVGLAIANGFAALAGSIYCQMNGFFEISSGTGTMVIGLASVIIGTKLLKNIKFVKATTAVIVGSIIYKGCISAAINMGMEASDLKLITAVLFLIILIISNLFVNKPKIVKEENATN